MRSRFTWAYLSQTLRRTLYLLLMFPLGLAYFVALVALIGVGVPMVIIWVGVPILALTIALWWYLARFERQLTNALLDAGIPPMTRPAPSGRSLWGKVKAHLRRGVTWRSLAYLMLEFPFGVLVWALLVVSIPVAIVALGMPVFHAFGVEVTTLQTENDGWTVDTFWEALLVSVAGLLLLLLLVVVINGLALTWRAFARLMLTTREPLAAAELLDDAVSIQEIAPTTPALAAFSSAVSHDGVAAPQRVATLTASSGADVLVDGLTEREKEVLALLAAGASNREIGERLYVTEGTVKRHTHNIYRKLEVNNRTQAVLRAGELGILNP